MSGLHLQDLRFAYPGSAFHLHVHDLRLAAGETLTILGQSGAGKTTLLRLMSGLLRPSTGSVELSGISLWDLPDAERRSFRLQHTGLIFQDFALLDYLTTRENILLPHDFSGAAADTADHARHLAELFGLTAHWERATGRLSQGERQRVAIARALAHRPPFIFADEPTAALDAGRRGVVMETLLKCVRDTQTCLVIVTHDPEVQQMLPRQVHVEEFTA